MGMTREARKAGLPLPFSIYVESNDLLSSKQVVLRIQRTWQSSIIKENLKHWLQIQVAAWTMRIFDIINPIILSFLSNPTGSNFIESLLTEEWAFHRVQLFLNKRERLWSLDHASGRLWDNSGSCLILGDKKHEIFGKIFDILQDHIFYGRFCSSMGQVLCPRNSALCPENTIYQLFIHLIIFPEIVIECCRPYFESSYALSEEAFLNHSKALIEVKKDTIDISGTVLMDMYWINNQIEESVEHRANVIYWFN